MSARDREENDDALAASEGLIDTRDTPDAPDAPSTTIFMASSGPLKAPSLVNSHRIRLSPNGDGEPEEAHPANTTEGVSAPPSVPKVNKLSEFVSSLPSHESANASTRHGSVFMPEKVDAGLSKGAAPPVSRRPSKLAEFLQVQPGPPVNPGVQTEPRKSNFKPTSRHTKPPERALSAVPQKLPERQKAEDSWIDVGQGTGVGGEDGGDIDDLSAMLEPSNTGPNKEREQRAFEAAMLKKLSPEIPTQAGGVPTLIPDSAPPPPPRADSEKKSGWLRFSCVPSGIMASCSPQAPSRPDAEGRR